MKIAPTQGIRVLSLSSKNKCTSDLTTDHLPMSMCGENLAVGRTESMPLLSLSFSPLTGTWSLWMAAGWSWKYDDRNICS